MAKAYRTYLSMAAALTVLLSCGKEGSMEREAGVSVAFIVETPQTKAVDETAVRTIDLLAFRHDTGTLESHVRHPASSGSMTLTPGVTMDWKVICNAPEGAFSDVYDIGGFGARLSLLTDNTPAHLVMSSEGSGVFGSQKDEVVRTEVSRLMSRVTLGKVTPVHLEGDVTHAVLRSVYLTNVAGSCPYTRDAATPPDGGAWHNRARLEDELGDDLSAFLFHGIGADITGGAAHDCNAVLYCYPNPCDNGTDSSTSLHWSARDTRLVIEVDCGGRTEYYPIDIAHELASAGLNPHMACNTSYDFTEVRLLGPGSPGPDIPVTREAISFNLSLTPWGDNNISMELWEE